MDELIQFVARNGYIVIFFGVLVEQIGIPLPSNLLLIIAGALVGAGQLDLAFVISMTVFAALLGDTIWYFIGRSRGFQVLGFLCKISLEPDYCVSNAKETFMRNGERALLIAKFVPGLSTFAQPLAGATKMSLLRFLGYDGFGSFLWAVAFIGLGYVFSDQLGVITDYVKSFGLWFGVILVAGLAIYLFWKFLKRKRFMKSLRIARIKPEDLKRELDAGEEVMIIDLRDNLDFKANPFVIPTTLRIPPEELEERHEELPRDQDIILYCT